MLSAVLAVSLAAVPLTGCSLFGMAGKSGTAVETAAEETAAETTVAAETVREQTESSQTETLSAKEREELHRRAQELKEQGGKKETAAGRDTAGTPEASGTSGTAENQGGNKKSSSEKASGTKENTGITVGAAPGGDGNSKNADRIKHQAPPATGTAEANAESRKDVVILGQAPPTQTDPKITGDIHYVSGDAGSSGIAVSTAVNPAGQIGPGTPGSGTGQTIIAGGVTVGPGPGAAPAPQDTSVHTNTAPPGSTGANSGNQGSGTAAANTQQTGSTQQAGGSGQPAETAAGAGSGQADGTQPAEQAQEPLEKIYWDICRVEGNRIVISGHNGGSITPADTEMGSDQNIYLLELAPYEDSISGHRYVKSAAKASQSLDFQLELSGGHESDRLYHKYVACIWDGGKYIAGSEPVYVTNPEVTAPNQKAYDEPLSKKGLLVEHSMIDDAFYIGVHNVIVNIPFNSLFGSGIDYNYGGETYHFNSSVIATYDNTISAFSNKNMNVNVVLLNGWNPAMPDFFYPGAKQSSKAAYHMFNASTERGYRNIRAVASFLSERYSGSNPNYGRVQNWIVGNEINNQYWNYIGSMDIKSYLTEFERCFRVFYTAIRSSCANDRVYFSLDHNWNRQADGKLRYNGRDVLGTFADLVNLHGNIDWNLAYHPYSEPLTEPEFWDDYKTGQVTANKNSPVINFANLGLLTQYLEQSKMRNRSGQVRRIILSEEGFTSKSATRGDVEEIQAAAFAYAYYMVDSNPYIDSFILSRQVDAPSELRESLAFGLWTTNSASDGNVVPAQRKKLWQVFKDIDRAKSTLETTEFAKKIIGIDKWSDIIPNFRWANQE